MILSLYNTDNYTYKYYTQIINNNAQITTHTENVPFITQTIIYIYIYINITQKPSRLASQTV